MLQIKDLTKSYGRRKVLDDLSLSLQTEDDTENDVQYFLLDPLTLEEIPVPTDELDDPIWNAFMYQD